MKDCATGIDELGCPVYVSPSFELPIYCCLVVLTLGVLLHYGWKTVTTPTAKEESIRMEINGSVVEALDSLVQAVVEENEPFPEACYEILHDSTGGIELLIGTGMENAPLKSCNKT